MMKKVVISLFVITTTLCMSGQKTDTIPGPWKFKGLTSLTLSQVSLVNWAPGGDNSMAVNALSVLNLDYTEGKSTWASVLDMGYGTQKTGNQSMGKTDDHFDLMSKYGHSTGKYWYLTGLLNLRSQFTKGYKISGETKTLISDFMSPGYLLMSLGMEYKPSTKFYFMISPIGGKATFVLNDTLSAHGSYGLDPGKTFRAEMGASARISLTSDIMKNVTLTTSMDLFSNLLDTPQNIDVNGKAMLDMKINKYLAANFSISMVYDDNIGSIDNAGIKHGPKVQFKEILGVGLSAKF
jgi:hypothetical protein